VFTIFPWNNLNFTFVVSKQLHVKNSLLGVRNPDAFISEVNRNQDHNKDDKENHSGGGKRFSRIQKLLITCGIGGISLFVMNKIFLEDNLNRKVIENLLYIFLSCKSFYTAYNNLTC